MSFSNSQQQICLINDVKLLLTNNSSADPPHDPLPLLGLLFNHLPLTWSLLIIVVHNKVSALILKRVTCPDILSEPIGWFTVWYLGALCESLYALKRQFSVNRLMWGKKQISIFDKQLIAQQS